MIGEIGGDEEEKAATFVQREVRKPMAAFIAGLDRTPGRRTGHAARSSRAARAPQSRSAPPSRLPWCSASPTPRHGHVHACRSATPCPEIVTGKPV